MSRCSLLAVVGLAAVASSIALAQPPKDTKPARPSAPAGQPQLPPGMSEAEMKACQDAATPGPKQAFLAQTVGVWAGKSKMWMGPDTEPTPSECTSTITSIMNGLFTKCEVSGDMPGMPGPFNGCGIYGYDNVAQKFQSTWIDNCGSGIMTGTGELSPDNKTLTWTYTMTCPINKKATTLREVERRTGKDTMTLEMYGADPHTGKEFKMMEIAFTRRSGGAPTTSPTR